MWRLLIAAIAGVALLAPAPGGSATTAKQLLAFARGGDVFTIASDGTGARRLIRDASSPSWSPEGKEIAFVSARSGDEEIYVARADGSRARRLTLLPGPDLSPAWSPDGRQLTWSRSGEIWTMSIFGSDKRRIVPKAQVWHEHHSPTWQGGRIVFSSNRISAFNAELYSVRAFDGGALRRLTFTKGDEGVLGDDGMPDFSPDGRRIAFTSNRVQQAEIYVMNADGSGQRRLTRKPGDDLSPRFSPEGREIAFTALPGTVYLVAADGSRLRRLTAGTDPAWKP
jgi:Tol biopolymer transport system component